MVRALLAEGRDCSAPRIAAANHTRPFLSNMPLWLLALLSQICLLAPVRRGLHRLFVAALPDPSASGCRRAPGSVKFVAVWVFGSRIGMMSVL